jgi:ADP-heptose:LPS heptosyltransferase
MIKQKNSLIDIVVAPGPGEFDDCKDYDAKIVMDGKKSTSFSQLAKILVGSIYVISNDTGPAHLASHLGCRGLAIFGSHTSAEKVSIETDRFSSISAVDLTELSASQVLDKIDSHLQIDDIIV